MRVLLTLALVGVVAAGASCPFNDVTNNLGASCGTTGCNPGEIREDTKGCMFFLDGYTCQKLVCNDGVWSDEGGGVGVVQCTENHCEFEALQMTSGASSVSTGCQAPGGTVLSGGSCVMTLSGHVCPTAACSKGKWTNAPINCVGDGCTSPSGPGSATGAGCNPSGTTADGVTCFYESSGATCAQTCQSGSWVPSSTTCSGTAPTCSDLVVVRIENTDITVAGETVDVCGYHLKATYTFSGGTELNSIYEWFQADDQSGTNMVLIPAATGKLTYNPQLSDVDKVIIFRVTPATSGRTGEPCLIAAFLIEQTFTCDGVVGPVAAKMAVQNMRLRVRGAKAGRFHA